MFTTYILLFIVWIVCSLLDCSDGCVEGCCVCLFAYLLFEFGGLRVLCFSYCLLLIMLFYYVECVWFYFATSGFWIIAFSCLYVVAYCLLCCL